MVPDKDFEYNEALYQPVSWEKPKRFVAMRIPKEQKKVRQLELFDDGTFMYRVFVTNLTQRPHKVITRYDKRADAENCIGEAQWEGILAIPSKNFQTNGMFFQLVMLTYNLWRWMKLTAGIVIIVLVKKKMMASIQKIVLPRQPLVTV